MGVLLLSSAFAASTAISVTAATQSSSGSIQNHIFLNPISSLTYPCKNLDFPIRTSPARRRNVSASPLRVAAPPTSSPSTSSAFEEEAEEPSGSEEEVEDENSSSRFLWRDHWYPVSLIEDLDPNLPTSFQLLGRDIVLWKDRSTGDWIAFDDKCPHRLAPLSEGRIDEDGNLQCSYHGWSFDLMQGDPRQMMRSYQIVH